jgi:hypothetical protein
VPDRMREEASASELRGAALGDRVVLIGVMATAWPMERGGVLW